MHQDIKTFADFLNTSIEEAESKLKNIDENLNYFKTPGKQTEFLYFSLLSSVINPENILEIGSGQGLTTRILSCLFPSSNIYTIDIPSQNGFILPREEDEEFFNKNINKENITFIIDDSLNLNKIFGDKKFDLIYVDGDHSFPRINNDLDYAYNHINKDGYIFIHDYNKPETDVKEALELFKPKIEEEIYLLPFNYSGTRDAQAKVAWIKKL